MAVGEKISAIANDSSRVWRGAAIDGHEFAKRVAFADLEVRGISRVFQILCALTDRAKGVEAIVRSNARRALEHDMTLQPRTRADLHIGADHAIRSDLAIVPDLRSGMNDDGGMDLRHVGLFLDDAE